LVKFYPVYHNLQETRSPLASKWRTRYYFLYVRVLFCYKVRKRRPGRTEFYEQYLS